MRKVNKFRLCVYLSLVLALLLGTASFSWFDRPHSSTNVSAFKLVDTSAIVKANSGCSVTKTVSLTLNQGNFDEETALNTTVTPGGVNYYRTTITNTGSLNNNVNLTGLLINGPSTGNNVVCCITPTKRYYKYNYSTPVAQHVTVPANGTLDVYWYVKNNNSSQSNYVTVPTTITYFN